MRKSCDNRASKPWFRSKHCLGLIVLAKQRFGKYIRVFLAIIDTAQLIWSPMLAGINDLQSVGLLLERGFYTPKNQGY